MRVKLHRASLGRGRRDGGMVDVTVKSASLDWARLMAPTWDMVGGHKDGSMSDEQYIKLYRQILDTADEKGVTADR